MYVKFFTSFCVNKYLMKIAEVVGNNIKQARKIKGYTQTEVAQILRMTQQQYSRFENGVFELNYTQIVQICNLLNITPNEIFGYDI